MQKPVLGGLREGFWEDSQSTSRVDRFRRPPKRGAREGFPEASKTGPEMTSGRVSRRVPERMVKRVSENVRL